MVTKLALPGTRAYRDAKKLYFAAFQPDEQLPFPRITLLSLLKPTVYLLSFYEGDVFCGFAFGACTEQYLYISFFAVPEELRSKGIGSKMVDALREKYPKPSIGECRQPDPDSPEYAQQLRRVEFWKRKGLNFYGDQHIVRIAGLNYIANGTEECFDRDAYWAVFDHFSFHPKALLRVLKRKFK